MFDNRLIYQQVPEEPKQDEKIGETPNQIRAIATMGRMMASADNSFEAGAEVRKVKRTEPTIELELGKKVGRLKDQQLLELKGDGSKEVLINDASSGVSYDELMRIAESEVQDGNFVDNLDIGYLLGKGKNGEKSYIAICYQPKADTKFRFFYSQEPYSGSPYNDRRE